MGLNYKFYNLRGDGILTLDKIYNAESRSMYNCVQNHKNTGEIFDLQR